MFMIKYFFYYYFKYEFKYDLIKIKRIVINKWIQEFWYNLWIRKNEFHKSLDINVLACFVMNEKEYKIYLKNLQKRRNIAHKRTL